MLMVGPMPSVYAGEADKPGAPVFKGLGDHHHPISTDNPQTQMFFDQGVNLLFGFNHAEAIRSFREAARLDPDCAMCWWGVAFALGPNINLPMPADAVGAGLGGVADGKGARGQGHARRARLDRGPGGALLGRPEGRPPRAGRGVRQGDGRAVARPPGRSRRRRLLRRGDDGHPALGLLGAGRRDPEGPRAEIVSTLEGIIKREPNHPGRAAPLHPRGGGHDHAGARRGGGRPPGEC